MAFSKKLTCANTGDEVDGQASPCPKMASKVCKGCELVQYCSRICQIVHWSKHKIVCRSPLTKASWRPSWATEQRAPAFVTNGPNDGPFAGNTPFGGLKYLWGNVPALDVLRLSENEGAQCNNDVCLLFAASGDLRNVVKTIAELSTTFQQHCEVFINDRDFDLVARNSILLLIALLFDSHAAAEAMIHVWYSALIPRRLFQEIRERVLPMIVDVCDKIQTRSSQILLAKSWKFGSRTLRLILRKSHWVRLPSYLEVPEGIPEGLSAQKAQTLRTSVMMAPSRRHFVHRSLYKQPGPWRVCVMEFRKHGILLPMSFARKDFDTPNPTIFQSSDAWPLKDSSNPLDGWVVSEVLKNAPPAKKDLYGSLYFHVTNIIQQFCQRLSELRVTLQLTCEEAIDMSTVLEQFGDGDIKFDGIEVSNIADRGYLGPKTTLTTFGPLLKGVAQNPHATLVALFLNATHEMDTLGDLSVRMASEIKQVQQYLPTGHEILSRGTFDPDLINFVAAQELSRDYDPLFERFMNECSFREISRKSKLIMKEENTIIGKWPMRLKKDATQTEFKLLHASGHTGSERYVEWKREN